MCSFLTFEEDFMNFLRFSMAAALVLGLASPLLGMKKEESQNPLFDAIDKGDLSEVQRILKTSPNGVVYEAYITAPKEITDIVEEYADLVNEPNKDGETPLIQTIRKNNLTIVQELLTHGADPFLKKESEDPDASDSPLYTAAITPGEGFSSNKLMIDAIIVAQEKSDPAKSQIYINEAIKKLTGYNDYIKNQFHDPYLAGNVLEPNLETLKKYLK